MGMGSLMATRPAVVLVWFALPGVTAQPGAANSWIAGVVYEQTGKTARPLPRAFVSVWSSGGELLGTTRANATGRYQFVNLPQGRLALEASKPGYQTRLAAGRAGSSIVIDCSKGCAQDGADFELSRGAAVTGIVVDRAGEPVSRARVSIQRTGDEEALKDTSDDRGRFRIAGLRAGQYTLTVEGRPPGGQPENFSETLEIGDGEQIDGLTITLGSRGSFTFAGRLGGIPFGEGYRTWVSLHALDGSHPRLQASVAGDGSFKFDSVPAGRYLGRAYAVERGTLSRSEYLLDVIDVRGEIRGLTLQPVGSASVTGTVEVAAGTIPPGATVQLTSVDGFGYQWFRCGGGKREFELSGVVPGTYRIHARTGRFYVKGLKLGENLETSNEVTLSPGTNQFTVVVAADHGLVYGTVRDPETRQLLPHAQVALEGDRGKLVVQTDQAGRFEFGSVIPGEYRICAWTNIAPEAIDDEASWQRGDCASKFIPIAAESDIEIDLHAAP